MKLKAKYWLMPFRSPGSFLFITFILLSLSKTVFSGSDESEKPQYLLEQANLYPDKTGGIISRKDDNSNWIAKPLGRIGEVAKGQIVTKVSIICKHRMKVTLDDGRQGWIDIPMVSPAVGTNAYLFDKVKLKDILNKPDRTGKPITIIDKSKKYKSFDANTQISIVEWYFDKKEYAKSLTLWPSELWAKVIISDVDSGLDYVGWLPSSKIRLLGQMDDDVFILIWRPIKWISGLLGDGFFAGFLILFLFIIPVLIGFVIAWSILLVLRFLPNFLLFLIIIFVAVVIYYQVYFSVFDASSFNLGNWHNEFMHVLFASLTLFTMFGVYKGFYEHTRETRCPSCRQWRGGAYNRKHLNTLVTTTTSTTEYSDGTSNKSVRKDVEENWKDYCSCANCGHYWTLYRTEKN